MQQFNKVTTYSNIIKNLLASTYLPLIRSVREGDYICKGRLYILRCEIIKCLSSGYIGSKEYLSVSPIAEWNSIGEFHFGEKDGKLSTNYVSNSEGYDFRTHERLGQYLRNLRDMYGLNLLPLYNCFSNQPLENHVIRNKKVVKTSDVGDVKVYKIPIRFNQDYTVAIENIGNTTIAPAFIRHNSLLKQNNTPYGNGVDVTNQYISLHYADNVKTYANTSFGRPIKVRFNNIPEKKTVVFPDFSNYISEYTLAIEENAADAPMFSKSIPYYELDDETYEKTLDSSPYTPYSGFTEETGIHYYENKVSYYKEYSSFPTLFSIKLNDEISSETSGSASFTFTDSEGTEYTGISISSGVVSYTTSSDPVEVYNDGWVDEKYQSINNTKALDSTTIAFLSTIATNNSNIYVIEKDYYTRLDKLAVPERATYEITNEICSQYADVEDHLYLLIQVPKTFNQNIVVLEGDYTDIEGNSIVSYERINDLPDFLYDDFYTHDLNLLTSTSTEPRPFSPTLVEYLLWNAISNLDTINNDFDRISIELFGKYIPNTEDLNATYPNFWFDRYRQIISDYISDNSTNVIQDNLGYITTAVESYMNKDKA